MKVFIIVMLSVSIFRTLMMFFSKLSNDKNAADYASTFVVGGVFIAAYITALVLFINHFVYAG